MHTTYAEKVVSIHKSSFDGASTVVLLLLVLLTLLQYLACCPMKDSTEAMLWSTLTESSKYIGLTDVAALTVSVLTVSLLTITVQYVLHLYPLVCCPAAALLVCLFHLQRKACH
jgi:hypothetical protein